MTARLRSAAASVRQFAGILLVASAVAGCGQRGEITLVDPASTAAGTAHQVIVATPRAPAAAPAYFSGERDFDLNFVRFGVSVPPDRKPGEIRYPKGAPDPQRDFVVTEAATLDGPRGFVSAINAAAARMPASERKGIIFVHGFNTNFAESLYKSVQLDHDLRTPGVGLLFSWPSRAKVLAYEADRESVLFARDDLAQTLRLMSKSNLDGFNVVAHSMGTFLTMETLRSMALAGEQATMDRINAVILISADIDIDVFRREAPPVLAAGIPIYLLVADDDKALRFSAAIRGDSARVGSVRTVKDLGNVEVTIVDLSEIESEGDGGHMKVATSPELIAFIQRIRASGIAIFDDKQKVGLLDHGAVLLQGTTGVILKPLGQ
jgi:esterase/lipase superfamily enzyme